MSREKKTQEETMATNLDAMINRIGFEIVEEIKKKGKDEAKYKNEIEKVLGVLSNDGVYAYYVYVKSKKIEDVFLEKIKGILEYIDIKDNNENSFNELNQEFFETLSENLSDLLFFREILEKILIYARYHSKAMGEVNE